MARRQVRATALIAIPLLGLVLGSTGVRWWRSHGIGPVQRGWTVASKRGCLACHGPSGRHQEAAEESPIGVVPSFVHDDVVAYSRHDGEIREWILDGKPRRIREQQGDEKPALLQMPAWRDRLSGQELEDLVAWIAAVSDFEEPPAPAASGREIAARLGCSAATGLRDAATRRTPAPSRATSPPGAGSTTRSWCATTASCASGSATAVPDGCGSIRSRRSSFDVS